MYKGAGLPRSSCSIARVNLESSQKPFLFSFFVIGNKYVNIHCLKNKKQQADLGWAWSRGAIYPGRGVATAEAARIFNHF